MTEAQKTTIDKLLRRLLLSTDEHAILASFSALTRKIKSSNIDPHTATLGKEEELDALDRSVVNKAFQRALEAEQQRDAANKNADDLFVQNQALKAEVVALKKVNATLPDDEMAILTGYREARDRAKTEMDTKLLEAENRALAAEKEAKEIKTKWTKLKKLVEA